jgi:hypothetical protein
MAVTDPVTGGRTPEADNDTARVIERTVILFAQAMVLLATAFVVYGLLVAVFFVCCGADAVSYFHPSRSPFGPVVTVVVVWPVVGLLCLALHGKSRDAFEATRRATLRLLRGVGSGPRT